MRLRSEQRIYGSKYQKGCRGKGNQDECDSESEVLNYVEDIDCLMVGPHLATVIPSLEEDCEGYDIKIALIDKEAYAKLNGDIALDQILELFGEK